MRLLKLKPQLDTRQADAIATIHRRRSSKEYGEGEIDNAPVGNYIEVDEVLGRSYRLTDEELNNGR